MSHDMFVGLTLTGYLIGWLWVLLEARQLERKRAQKGWESVSIQVDKACFPDHSVVSLHLPDGSIQCAQIGSVDSGRIMGSVEGAQIDWDGFYRGLPKLESVTFPAADWQHIVPIAPPTPSHSQALAPHRVAGSIRRKTYPAKPTRAKAKRSRRGRR